MTTTAWDGEVRAVEVACAFDPATGAPIETLELGLSQKREESK